MFSYVLTTLLVLEVVLVIILAIKVFFLWFISCGGDKVTSLESALVIIAIGFILNIAIMTAYFKLLYMVFYKRFIEIYNILNKLIDLIKCRPQ